MKRATPTMTKTASKAGKAAPSPSPLITARITELGDWRGETLARVRALIKQADPCIVEEVKWRKPSNAMRGVQMIPQCSHTGTLRMAFDGFLHFTSSATFGSACLIKARTRTSVSPRQSPGALMRSAMRWEGEGAAFTALGSIFFIAVAVFNDHWTIVMRTCAN